MKDEGVSRWKRWTCYAAVRSSAGWRMVKADQLSKYVIRPALQAVGLHRLQPSNCWARQRRSQSAGRMSTRCEARRWEYFRWNPRHMTISGTATSGIGLN